MQRNAKPIYAVLTPMQNDGGGEWINPEFQVYFETEYRARAWARDWAMSHPGTATVFLCTAVADITCVVAPQILEKDW